MTHRGQALVETALVLPLLLFIVLGFAEVAILYATRHEAQVSVDVLAATAAERMTTLPGDSWNAGWQALVDDEAARASCHDDAVAVTFPDETHEAGDRVRVTMTCAYRPIAAPGLWPGLRYSVHGAAVVGRAPEPTPSPSASVSP